jgi:MFS family permease
MALAANEEPIQPWYRGITRQQWLVLAVASAGWVFDVYEGQIFNITAKQLLADVLEVNSSDPAIKFNQDRMLGIFLAGGTVGGLLFGSLADRWGRRPTMIVTILMYSVFSGLTYFADSLWQVAVLRFLVATGVGGEWAVAAALVAEVFPKRARAQASGIFHATSILGTWLATLASMAVGAQWRYCYLIGVLPASLILWVRASVQEPEAWVQAGADAREDKAIKPGSFRELLFDKRWRSRALLGMCLAAVGLGSFWAVTVAGQGLAEAILLREGFSDAVAAERAKFAYGFVETAGGGLGLLAFGPLCVKLGRRRAFFLIQLAALCIVPIACFAPSSYRQLLFLLPIYGFLTLGMHAGFAVYFPELFPTHLRATGTGFCFNGGRLLAAPMLYFSGWFKALPGMDLRVAVSWLGLIFIPGLVVVWFLPETKGQALPES